MTDRPSDRAIAQAFWDVQAYPWEFVGEFEGNVVSRAREIDAATPEPITMRNMGDSEQTFIADSEIACPHCGGSGHRADIAAAPEGAQTREDDQIVTWLRRFDETTADCGETDLSKDKLAALVACGYLSKRRAGPHGWRYIMTQSGHAVLERACTTPPQPQDAALVPIAWRHETPLGTGYKFADEFLAKWPEFPQQAEDAARGRKDAVADLSKRWRAIAADRYISRADRVYIEGYDKALTTCADELDAARAAGGGDHA